MKEEELKISDHDNNQHDSQGEEHRDKHHKKRHHHHKKHESHSHTKEEGQQDSKKVDNILGSSTSVRVIEVQVEKKQIVKILIFNTKNCLVYN